MGMGTWAAANLSIVMGMGTWAAANSIYCYGENITKIYIDCYTAHLPLHTYIKIFV